MADVRYDWERITGGRHPLWYLRGHADVPPRGMMGSYIVASLRLSSPKRGRWTLEMVDDDQKIYFDNLTQADALASAKAIAILRWRS